MKIIFFILYYNYPCKIIETYIFFLLRLNIAKGQFGIKVKVAFTYK